MPANTEFQPQYWSRDSWQETFGRELPTKLVENWPSDVRIAVLLTFDTQGDIDAAVPNYQLGGCFWEEDRINYCDLTQRQYDTRRGISRILEMLDRHEIKGTFPVPGLTAEWYPEMIAEIDRHGHEVAVHGYRHIQLFKLDEAEEIAEIDAATEAVETALGRRPVGWRTPMYSTTKSTIRLLTERGYLYNSDFHNDDMPYILENDAGQIVEIPAGMDDWELNLMKVQKGISMGGQPFAAPGDVTDILVSHFNMLYQEAAEEPRIWLYTMHPKITGRPFRAWGLEQTIRHMESHPGVAFWTMEEVAQLCH